MTIQSLEPACDARQCALLAACTQRLTEALRAAWQLWLARDGAWLPIDRDGQLQWDRPELEDRLASLDRHARDARDVRVEPLGPSRWLMMVPIIECGRPLAWAVAELATAEPHVYRQLARQVLDGFYQQEQIEQLIHESHEFARQVTDNFEELVFLRDMARHLEVVELSKDVLQMAESVLPLLARSIKAETMVVLSGPSAAGEAAEPAGGREAALHYGSRRVDAPTCWELVQRHGREALDQPVVKNGVDSSPDAVGLPHVRSFILVPLIRSDQFNSWLLALNRAGDADPELVQYLGANEFGTGEATLLSSAASMLSTHASNVELFREKEKLLIDVVRVLVYAVEAKDEYTCGHSERVALFARRLAEHLGMDETYCERIYLTGLLHDVGKIGVSDATLCKPGHLTDEEFEEIKRHPESGWAILHELAHLRYTLEGVLYHHERVDGKGYPDGLTAEQIPLDGRILAVVDSYDAMTSDRPYRNGMPQAKAEAILRAGAGTQWDEAIVNAFFEIMPDIMEIRATYRSRPPRTRRRGTVQAERLESEVSEPRASGAASDAAVADPDPGRAAPASVAAPLAAEAPLAALPLEV